MTDATSQAFTGAAPNALHWRDRMINFGAQHFAKGYLTLPLPLSLQRASFEASGRMRPRARGVRVEYTTLAGRTAATYTPPNPERRIVWVHGGGFITGSPTSHAGMLSHLAAMAKAVVIAPSYRLAPENPFPAGLEDVEAALADLDTIRPDLTSLSLGADSAGGCLLTAALPDALRQGLKADAMILASPTIDPNPERLVPDAADLLFTAEGLRMLAGLYTAGCDVLDPRACPIHADLKGAPPTLLHCASGEYLEGDCDNLAANLRRAGVPVRVEKAENAPHVWHFMAASSPRAMASLRSMADFVISKSN
ncbi:MAG: alpha/beta hydrolase [Shimia sp.]